VGKRSRTSYSWGVAASIFLGIALAFTPGGIARASTPAASLNGGVAAFEGPNTDLYLCDIPHKGCTATTLGMEAGASPTVYSLDNGLVWAAFEANTGKLYVTERSAAGAVKNINTGLGMANLTTPSITEYIDDPDLTYGIIVAYQGAGGHLDIYTYDITTGSSTWFDTGQVMYPGTSPSAVAANDGFTVNTQLVVAYANSANHIGVYYASVYGAGSYTNAYYTNTTLGMYAGSSPSVTATSPSSPNDYYSLAFDDNDGQLYLAYFGYAAAQSNMRLENIGLPIYPGTNPSLPQTKGEGSNANEVSAYMGITGYLCAWNDGTKQQNCGSNQLVEGSPAIALVQGDYWAAFQSPASGNFRAVNTATGSYFEQPIHNNTNTALSN
jgi:hypothetical protein